MAFTDWGQPLEIQTDHEVVYTDCPEADFPSLFTLWLVGLGIAHVASRDRARPIKHKSNAAIAPWAT